MIQIDPQEYISLIMDRDWLQALESAGVDNWEGYELAKEIYQEMTEVKGD